MSFGYGSSSLTLFTGHRLSWNLILFQNGLQDPFLFACGFQISTCIVCLFFFVDSRTHVDRIASHYCAPPALMLRSMRDYNLI